MTQEERDYQFKYYDKHGFRPGSVVKWTHRFGAAVQASNQFRVIKMMWYSELMTSDTVSDLIPPDDPEWNYLGSYNKYLVDKCGQKGEPEYLVLLLCTKDPAPEIDYFLLPVNESEVVTYSLTNSEINDIDNLIEGL